MATSLQLRKGTTTEHSTFVGANGEVTVDTTKKALVLHDGVTAGGKPLPTLEGGKVPVAQLPDSTTSTKGVVQLATQYEVNEGLYAEKVVTSGSMYIGIRHQLNASGIAPMYACRAWVNFNGAGTVAIRASGNVSSITDNGAGDYTVNLTTGMQDTSYVALATGGRDNASHLYVDILTTTTVRVLRGVTNAIPLGDVEVVNVAIFR